MTTYINTETLEYPLHDGDITEMSEKFATVEETPFPEVLNTQKAIEQSPQFIDGRWIRVWQIVEKTAEEIQFEQDLANSFLPNYQRNH